MNKLSEKLNPKLIENLKLKCQRGFFPGIPFQSAMKFILTDGLMPETGAPVTSFLQLEDWIQNQDQPIEYSATELKNKTGEILDQVLKGHTILLLKHGRPVAKIIPNPD